MDPKKRNNESFFFSLTREFLPHSVEKPGDDEYLSDRTFYLILAIISVCIALCVSFAFVLGMMQ